MAKGLMIPVQAGVDGRSRTREGDDYAKQTLYNGLAGHDNDNAFQQDSGLGEGMIFGISGTSLKSSILRRLYVMFDEWEAERLFRLMRESIRWEENEEGELILTFKYINLETDEVQSFHKRFLSGG